MKKEAIILVDVPVDDNWEFACGIKKTSEYKWIVKWWNNAGLMNNKWSVIKRYIGYFAHSFMIFINRKKYSTIVAWQQFYGLIFAWYCAIFKVKKRNKLIVMTFIYKDKKNIFSSLYKKFISYILHSGYVDKFIVFSNKEVEYYSRLFHMEKSCFTHINLGITSKKVQGEAPCRFESPFLLSVGRSNRDYDFLFRCADRLPYPLIILTDIIPESTKVPSNVTILNSVRGEEYFNILKNCYAVLIPLDNSSISSGQLVMLNALKYEKPIIITESDAISDYVVNEVNALITAKDEEKFIEAVYRLVDDKKLYEKITKNGIEIFNKKFSLLSMGANVGNIVKALM